MNLTTIKKWYGFVLHVGLGSFYILGNLIQFGAVNGTYLVFMLALIALPILKLVYPNKITQFSLYLAIFDGLFAITGVILTFAILDQFYIGLAIVLLFGTAYWFESESFRKHK